MPTINTSIELNCTKIPLLIEWQSQQDACCCKETAWACFPTPSDSLIVICFSLWKVKAVIALA